MNLFLDWISPVENDEYNAFCLYCKMKLVTRQCGLIKHAETEKHKEAMRTERSLRSILCLKRPPDVGKVSEKHEETMESEQSVRSILPVIPPDVDKVFEKRKDEESMETERSARNILPQKLPGVGKTSTRQQKVDDFAAFVTENTVTYYTMKNEISFCTYEIFAGEKRYASMVTLL